MYIRGQVKKEGGWLDDIQEKGRGGSVWTGGKAKKRVMLMAKR